jgi:hypothetical protein
MLNIMSGGPSCEKPKLARKGVLNSKRTSSVVRQFDLRRHLSNSIYCSKKNQRRSYWHVIGRTQGSRRRPQNILRTENFNRNPPYRALPAAARQCSSSGYDPHPACFASCLTPTGGSTSTWLVDVQQAPFLGAASRLSAASFNIRLPPQICPHPPRRRTTHGI